MLRLPEAPSMAQPGGALLAVLIMTTLLFWLALTAQTADTVQTCHVLRHGGVELNPLLPQSCAGIAAIKGAAFLPLFVISQRNRRILLAAHIVSGGVGFGLTLALN